MTKRFIGWCLFIAGLFSGFIMLMTTFTILSQMFGGWRNYSEFGIGTYSSGEWIGVICLGVLAVASFWGWRKLRRKHTNNT